MSALTCDICGGNLTMNESGEFAVCESCGMKHTKERVKVKVQEIKGVVEITKGEAEKERLLKNAETFLNLNEMQKAVEIYRDLTNDYPDDYRGWYGLASLVIRQIKKTVQELLDDGSEVSFNSISYHEREIRIIADGIFKLNDFYKKLVLLDKNVADELTRHEQEFIDAYCNRKLPFINWLSAIVLTHYNIVKKCSPNIQQWAEEIVNQYIEKFCCGEITELFWRIEDPYKETLLYPAAITFLQKAYDNAQHLNRLETDKRRYFLRSLGMVSDGANKCVFWMGSTLVFISKEGYRGRDFFYSFTTSSQIDFSNLVELVNSKSQESESKCCEAQRLIAGIRDDWWVLREIITNFTEDKIRKSLCYCETDFSYRITTINTSSLEYVVSYKWNDDQKMEIINVNFNYSTNFDDILVVLRRHSNKCIHCGGVFKGLFTKVCTECGKPKDY